MSNPELQARSTPAQLAGIRNGYVINEADKLREEGNYAAAYDKLIRALQSDPQNTRFDVRHGPSVPDRQNEQRSGRAL